MTLAAGVDAAEFEVLFVGSFLLSNDMKKLSLEAAPTGSCVGGCGGCGGGGGPVVEPCDEIEEPCLCKIWGGCVGCCCCCCDGGGKNC